jgi:tetratricopeptide (TPR) repeat protein
LIDALDLVGVALIAAGAGALAWGALRRRADAPMPFAASLGAAFALCVGLALLLFGDAPPPAPPAPTPKAPAPPVVEALAAPAPPVVVIPAEEPAPPGPALAVEDPAPPDPEAALRDEARARATQFNTLGFRAYKRRDYQEAQRWYERATREDASYGLAWYNLACVKALASDADGALEALRQLRACDPDADLTARVRDDDDFEMLRQDPDFMAAVARLQRDAPAAAPAPAPSNALRRRAGVEALQRGDHEQARAQFLAAAQQDPSDASSWFGLARAEAARGDQEGAVRALERYRALRPQEDLLVTLGQEDDFAAIWPSAWFQAQLKRLAR